jgi:BlaR1 peptidase M56/surface antigen-like variable number repeat protein
METLLLESAVRAILIAAGTGLVLSVMRIKHVVARHHAWTAVLLFMLMVPLWTAFGYQVPVRVLSPIGQQSERIRPISAETNPIVSDFSSPVPERHLKLRPLDWRRLVLGVYFLGVSVLLLRLGMGTIAVYFLIRRARREQGRLTSSLCVSPITIGWMRAVTILPDGWIEWSQPKLDAVLAHEGEHVRRNDPFWQWLALLNRAVFWFHPLAWWLERKLAALAEEACDIAVLERGHEPREYSEYLLDLAGSVRGARKRLRVLGMAMPGCFLPQRIQKIMRGTQDVEISRSRVILTILVCTVVSVVLATGTLAHARLAPISLAGQTSPGSNATGTRDFRLSELKKGAVTKAITWQAGVTVTRVQIANNRRIPTDTIRSKLETKVGDPVSLAAISRDIRALYSLGFFDDVQFETESAGNGMIITFLVKERPLIRAILYKGPPSVTIAEIRQELRNAHTGLSQDSPYSLDRATAAAEVLKSMLVAKGYAQATVGIATERVPPNAVNVVFVVDEGTR